MDCEKAIDMMTAAIAARQKTFNFPWQMRLMTTLLKHWPETRIHKQALKLRSWFDSSGGHKKSAQGFHRARCVFRAVLLIDHLLLRQTLFQHGLGLHQLFRQVMLQLVEQFAVQRQFSMPCRLVD